MNYFYDIGYRLGYNISYYVFQGWFSLKHLTGRFRRWWYPKKKVEEKIEISHVYFRPTSDLRDKPDFDTKDLVWEVDSVHNLSGVMWDITKKHLSDKKGELLTGDTLEVHYTVPFSDSDEVSFKKSYIVPYTYPAKILFPPYSLKQVRDHYNSNRYKPGVLSAEIGDRDITNETERWIGPLDNFYNDHPPRDGICVSKKLVTGNSNLTLSIMNTDGDEFEFKEEQVLLVTKPIIRRKVTDMGSLEIKLDILNNEYTETTNDNPNKSSFK